MDRNPTIFSGNTDDWDTWKFLFQANAVAHGYDVILDGTESIPKISEVKRCDPDEKDAFELKKLQLYKLNSLAMVRLIKSMNSKTSEGKVAICILKITAKDDYPTGSAYIGFQKLTARYSSKVMKGRMDRELYKRKQRPDEDPDTYITELELIRYQNEPKNIGCEITDKDFCEIVLNGLSKDYLSFTAIYSVPGSSIEPLQSIEELREKLNRCIGVGAVAQKPRYS